MFIIHVYINVKTDSVEAFKAATLLNARLSLLERGVLRFDVVQDAENPCKFVLVEIYRDAAANAAHKETPHYAAWNETVAAMMAEPRTRTKFNALLPGPAV